jgi:hypothetical protein
VRCSFLRRRIDPSNLHEYDPGLDNEMAGHPEEFLCVPHELYDVVVAAIRMVVSFVASVTWKSSLNT